MNVAAIVRQAGRAAGDGIFSREFRSSSTARQRCACCAPFGQRHGSSRAPAQRRGEPIMETDGSGRTPRWNASHVVDAEIEHLEWATRQPMLDIFDAQYWRRRVLAVQGSYELTLQQGRRIERMLRRLAEPIG
jgi:hypothetical protein